MNNYKDVAALAMFPEQFIALGKNNNEYSYTVVSSCTVLIFPNLAPYFYSACKRWKSCRRVYRTYYGTVAWWDACGLLISERRLGVYINF
jgi:hypothetical protein